jgi:hypothetical protein
MTLLAQRDGIDILGVDIGGATTDIFSVIDGSFNRTVSANLGMSYSAGNVLAKAGLENILRFVPFDLSEGDLADEIMDKLVYPTTVPATIRDLLIEQALAREALRLSLRHHSSLIKSLPKERAEWQRAFTSQGANVEARVRRSEILDMQKVELLVGSGGVLSHAPGRAQAAAMLLDAFQPKGYTYLAVDSIFMMPHLGVLSQLEPEIALHVLERDCFIPLGPSFSIFGNRNPEQLEQTALHYQVRGDGVTLHGTVRLGELKRLAFATGQLCQLELQPAGSLDVGAGPGRSLIREVAAGCVGIILDARGRDWTGLSAEQSRRMAQQALLELGALTEAELRHAAGGVGYAQAAR